MSNCIFCKWIKTDYREVKDENRLLNNPDNDGYLVVLDRAPKVDGHTLIISKKHYNDITKLEDEEIENDDKMCIFRGVIKWAHKIKKEINKKFNEDFGEGEEKVKKVYVLSMCDHWTNDELRKLWQYSTEHLHFHLIPRYDFDEEIRGEEVLIRGVELKSKKLKPKEKLGIKEIFDLLKETEKEERE